MSEIINNIRRELSATADSKVKEGGKRFFKEPIKLYGVKTAAVGQISGKYWRQAKNLSKEKIFALCEELYKSDYCEEAFIVSYWLPKISKNFQPSDFSIFENWINNYINNWAKCDGFCNHTMGDFIQMYPQYIKELKRWAKSQNRWLKRAAAVSLIVPAKNGNYLSGVFEISSIMLQDPDDMVQKGYGWLLKVSSRPHQKEVFDFVIKNKKLMPRTALRYAIELMPENLKTKAMAKE